MIEQPVIQSLLDTDLYKLTMMQLVFHRFADIEVEYQFKCRTENVNLMPLVPAIEKEISLLCQLRFSEDEINYLHSMNLFKADFIYFLQQFQLSQQAVYLSQDDDQLDIRVKGSWLQTIMFEVPILAIVEEVYSRQHYPSLEFETGQQKLVKKSQMIAAHPLADKLKIMEFGTRRRFSRTWQQTVLEYFSQHNADNLVGTSNIYYARQLGIKPLGTMAHEFLQAFQALTPCLIDSQKTALNTWLAEYQGKLGIALTDVLGIDAFIKDFDQELANAYQGVRHDSGCPFEWANKMIKHYQALGIATENKTLVFSDGLDIPLAFQLLSEFHQKANIQFGIGTSLTNDLGIKPLSIVMKMIRCNQKPVAKISDSPGKTMCSDTSYLAHLSKVFDIDSKYDDTKGES